MVMVVMIEMVVALLMIVNGEIKEHRIQVSMSDCLKGKRIANRQTTKGKDANYRPTKSGAGMTAKGVAKYRKDNPGSKLKTAVTTPPSKLKKGSKAAKRRKAFCARSKSWKSERGLAARRKWNC